jgi:hypothetical protein
MGNLLAMQTSVFLRHQLTNFCFENFKHIRKELFCYLKFNMYSVRRACLFPLIFFVTARWCPIPESLDLSLVVYANGQHIQ